MSVRIALFLLLPVALAGCDEILAGLPDGGTTPESIVGDCEAHDAIRERLEDDALGDGIRSFETRSFDVQALRDAFIAGEEIELPYVDLQGEVRTWTTRPVPWPSGDQVRVAQQKGGDGELLQTDEIPDDIAFQMGCNAPTEPCGYFAFLDPLAEDPRRFEGMIVDPEHGWTVIESVPSLLENLTLDDPPPGDKCGVIYNSAYHAAISFDDDEPEGVQSFGEGDVDGSSWIIPIVLDADETFYNQNPETAWTRQRSVLVGVNLMYHFIEPLSSGNFDILFALEGQEAWVTPGTGPDELDRVALSDRINADDYEMISHPENNEVSYFFVGYDLDTGIAGRAPGLCNVTDWDITFGSDEDPQQNHAWGQQVPDANGYAFATLYGRMVVMAHEIGHMLGATHGDGVANGCAGGGMSNLCGSSMMKSGAAGGVAPDFRQPFLTDANDANIVGCVGDVVP